jgi:hypothetical protein
LFELQAEKNAYDFKTEEVTSQIKFQIASEKDDKDKKKFSNDLERELEFKKRFDVTMYNSIIAEKLKNITTKGLALNHAKNIFSLYFEFFVKLA